MLLALCDSLSLSLSLGPLFVRGGVLPPAVISYLIRTLISFVYVFTIVQAYLWGSSTLLSQIILHVCDQGLGAVEAARWQPAH